MEWTSIAEMSIARGVVFGDFLLRMAVQFRIIERDVRSIGGARLADNWC